MYIRSRPYYASRSGGDFVHELDMANLEGLAMVMNPIGGGQQNPVPEAKLPGISTVATAYNLANPQITIPTISRPQVQAQPIPSQPPDTTPENTAPATGAPIRLGPMQDTPQDTAQSAPDTAWAESTTAWPSGTDSAYGDPFVEDEKALTRDIAIGSPEVESEAIYKKWWFWVLILGASAAAYYLTREKA